MIKLTGSGRIGLIVSTVSIKIERSGVMEDGFKSVCLRAGTTQLFETYTLASTLGTRRDYVGVLCAADATFHSS